MNDHSGIVSELLELPLFHAAWVLWLLLAVSLVAVAVMVERSVFYRRHRVDVDALRTAMTRALDQGDFEEAARGLRRHDSLETNVVLFGLLAHRSGPDSVQDLIEGAMSREKQRYDRGLDLLATVASNAPFVGLFGTVLGIIRAFHDLSRNVAAGSEAVMAGIAEALIATAVGLLVAIPAVIAFNAFKARVRHATGNTQLLARVLLAKLKAVDLGKRPAHG